MESTGARVSSAPLRSPENGGGREETARALASGDTGFFESSEDCGSYMVLEGYGGLGESSTDEDLQGGEKELGARWVSAADSGIDLKKLLSASSQPGGAPNLSRQVMTHLRVLQASLQYLKDVENRYNQLRQSMAAATDTDENKDKS